MPIPKSTVAIEHLQVAVACFHSKKYLAALHLAGAAEEILGKIVLSKYRGKILQKTPALDQLVEGSIAYAEDAGIPAPTPKAIRDELNLPRNASKHFDRQSESLLDFDPRDEALQMLKRAAKNYVSAIDAPHDEAITSFLTRLSQ